MNSDEIEQRLTEAAQLFQAEKFDEAEAACDRLLEQSPEQPQALQLIGFIYFGKQQPAKAIEFFTRATKSAPENIEVHFNLARAYEELGDLNNALISFEAALQCLPNDFDTLNALGRINATLNNHEAAEGYFRQITALAPDNVAGHVNLGNVLNALRRFDEAETCYRIALNIDDHLAPAYNGLGRSLLGQNKIPIAIETIQQALHLNPEFTAAYINLGDALKTNGSINDAIDSYHKALKLDPENADAHFNLSLALLLSGDLATGWQEYEWRWQWEHFKAPKRNLPQTEWQGEELAGKSVVVWGEQGIGDEIMFASMLADLTGDTNEAIIECEPRLKPIFERSFSSATFVPKADQPQIDLINAKADYQIAIGSLGQRYRRSIDAFPKHDGYLQADTNQSNQFRQNYRGQFPGKKLIGISWKSGNEELGAARSATLDLWQPVFENTDCAFINLQYGDVAAELSALKQETGSEIYHDDSVDPLKNMDTFAAQLTALDLVISIDNSTVHLAGAMGVPTWTLLPTAPDWRWMLECSTSPWYPAMRLFRQQNIGSWADVFEHVSKTLKETR